MIVPTLSRQKRWLHLGSAIDSNRRVDVSLEYLRTHLHIIGPPGSGKTRLLFWIFQLLCRPPEATVILLNPKGDLCHLARDWAISHGATKRLIWFDPGDQERVIGYNPVRPNHLPIATHAKAVREAIRSSWGQSTLYGSQCMATICRRSSVSGWRHPRLQRR